MPTYCILRLKPDNKHLTLEADGSFVPTDGKEKPILFLSVFAAEQFIRWQRYNRINHQPCRWGGKSLSPIISKEL